MKDNPPVPELPDLHSRRLQRIREYQANALEKDDPLAACIGSINAEMMQIQAMLGESIVAELKEETRTFELFQTLEKPIEMHQRIARQVERYVRVERQQERQTEASKFQPGIPAFPTKDHSLPKSENLAD